MNIGVWVVDISNTGGTERVAVNLSNAFVEKYHVTLISTFYRKGNVYFDLDPRVKLKVIIKGNQQLHSCYFQSCKKVKKLLSCQNIDVILLINTGTYLFLPFLNSCKTVKIACEHLNLKNKYQNSSILLRFMRLLAPIYCHKIVTLTEEDRKDYLQRYHLANSKVISIYNWIDLQEFSLEPEDLVPYKKKIITVGRYDPVKGYDLLVHVADIILKKFPDWEWHIYGDGDLKYKNYIKDRVKEHGLEKQLKLFGNVSDIIEKYLEYDFFVMTSRYEGLPMVLLEAKSRHLPLVAFDCPNGPREIIADKINGFLIPCYDVSEMARSITQLIEDTELYKAFVMHSVDNIDKFSKKNILNQWYQLFHESIDLER